MSVYNVTDALNLSFFKKSLRLFSKSSLSGALSRLNAATELSVTTIAHTPIGFFELLTTTSYIADIFFFDCSSFSYMSCVHSLCGISTKYAIASLAHGRTSTVATRVI